MVGAITCISASTADAQQNLIWDTNGAGAGTGGTGAWNTTSPFWFDGATIRVWNNVPFDNAIFAGSAGTVTLGTPINAHNLIFDVGGYTLSGGTLTLGGASPSVISNVAVTTINSALSGGAGLVKGGAATLALGGNSTGYTGVTTVNAGTLRVNSASALGASVAAGDLILNNGSTFFFNTNYAHNYTVTGGTVNLQGGLFTWSGAPTLTAATILNLNGTITNSTLSGSLADTGGNVLSLVRNGVGRIILSGANTYSGATTITRGALQLGSASALSANSNLVFDGAVTTAGSLELTAASGNFIRNLGAGAGQVQWLGSGGFVSSGASRVVNLGGAGATLAWGLGGFVPDGNRLVLGTVSNHTLDFRNAIDLSGGVRSIQGDGGLASGHARMSGILSGTGGLNQVGNGILELTGANTYLGGTVITSGTLLIGSDANLGAASGTLTFDGGSLQNTAAFATGRSITINAAGGTILANTNLVAGGPVGGAGHLTKAGVAALILTGADTHSGGTTISAGTLQIGNGGTTGSIVGSIANNGVLAFNRVDDLIFGGAVTGAGGLEQRGAGTTILSGDSTYSGGTTISAGTLQIGNGSTIGSIAGGVVNNGVLAFNRSDDLAFAGTVTGGGVVDQRGSGSTTLSGENTYTGGTELTAGTLVVGTDANLGAASGQLTFDGGTLRNTGSFATGRVVTLNAPGGTIQTDANLTANGSISGAGQLTKTGVASLILTGDSTYTGGTAISVGTLQIGNGGITGSLAGDIIDNGLLAFNRSDELIIDGAISGSGSLSQEGVGVTILSGDNTYLGGTTINSGTIQIGNGGESGSIVGDVANNGELAFDRSDDLIFSGTINGVGSLQQQGGGVTTLSGDNTYLGGTTISAGALQIGNGGTTGSIIGDVANDGELIFNRSDELVFAGAITGGGALEQQGGGVTILSGDSTYSGGTAISAGTIQIGNGETTGSIIGDVVNNGELAFNRSADLTFRGGISGAGSLEQLGTGAIILTGDNTYSGGTLISAGALQIGNGGTTGSIVGNVTTHGDLAFNLSNMQIFDGALSGAGNLHQLGSGTLVLSGNSTAFAGTTSIIDGTLAVNGALGGTLNVLSGGRLQGTGTIGTTSVESGGTLAPGAPFGTLTAVGDVTFAPDSIYEVKSDQDGILTRLLATGTATINDGIVKVVTNSGLFRTGARYTILTADSGLIGEFSELIETLPLIEMSLAYDLNNVYLDVARNSATLCSLAVTDNQCAVSTIDASLGSGNPVYDAVVGLPDLQSIQSALDQLSGEIYVSTKSTLLENSRYVREAVLSRARRVRGSSDSHVTTAGGSPEGEIALKQGTIWGSAFGSLGHQNGDGNAARIDTSIGGLFLGADTVIADRFLLGIAVGYSNSTFKVEERDSSASSDDYHVALYGDTKLGPIDLRFGAAYTWHELESDRHIDFGRFSDDVDADYTSRTVQAFGEAGYVFQLGDLELEPFAQLAHVRLHTDSFDESGGPAALQVSDDNDHLTYTTLGMNLAQSFTLPNSWIATARGTLGWRHTFGDVAPSTHAVGDSSTFDISTVPIANDALVVKAGVNVEAGDSLSLSIDYVGQISDDAADNGMQARLNWRF